MCLGCEQRDKMLAHRPDTGTLFLYENIILTSSNANITSKDTSFFRKGSTQNPRGWFQRCLHSLDYTHHWSASDWTTKAHVTKPAFPELRWLTRRRELQHFSTTACSFSAKFGMTLTFLSNLWRLRANCGQTPQLENSLKLSASSFKLYLHNILYSTRAPTQKSCLSKQDRCGLQSQAVETYDRNSDMWVRSHYRKA